MVVNGINKFGVYFGRKLEFSYTKIDSNSRKTNDFIQIQVVHKQKYKILG